MTADLIVKNIGELTTGKPSKTPLKGAEMNFAETFKNAFIAVKDGRILDYGSHDFREYMSSSTKVVDALGKIATPGLIDSHTHVVHGGSREHEFEKKLKGVPYLDILKAGGGIHSTVEATKKATFEQLYQQSKKSLIRMIKGGVTTVEGKSGYGLDHDTELKQLKVQKKLHEDLPIDIVPTYLGAHALPKAFKTKREDFLKQVVELFPIIKKEDLARYVDIFCEDGAFTVADSKYVLSEAQKAGFKLKIHADEIYALGGVPLAASMHATSCDHLMAINQEGIQALKKSNTIATLLPNTSFYLNSTYAPARKMIESGLAIALASDYNPGSSPSENFLFTLNIAAIHLKMTPYEILNAATINAAFAVDEQDHKGVIAKNYHADFVLYDAPNWTYVLYHYATNHVSDVFKLGHHVVKEGQYKGDKDYETR